MKTLSSCYPFLLLALLASVFSACEREDAGPYQPDEQSYSFVSFDRLDMGNAFRIHVQQGSQFSIRARGDRRNLNDLDVWVSNGTLRARYRNNRNRQYDTSFDITMPDLRGVDFSGAVSSDIAGFDSTGDFDIKLSGASKADVTLQANRVNADLSGSSRLFINGTTNEVKAELSGASLFEGFGLQSRNGDIEASGASTAKVKVSESLRVNASGASHVRYIGNPQLNVSLSGASTVQRE